MKKQILSVVLCLSMLLSIFAINLTVNATTLNKNESKASTTDKKTGVSKITSKDTAAVSNSLKKLSFTKASKQMADLLKQNMTN